MKKNILLIIICAFLISSCTQHSKKHQELVNKSEKDTTFRTSVKWLDSIINLGTISSGDKKEIVFKCLNTGNKPLVLLDVRPGCGCTIASFTDGEIMPQKEGWVKAIFNSKGQCDSVQKEIIVTTNSKPDSIKVLIFKAHIINCKSNDIIVPRHETPEEESSKKEINKSEKH